MSAVLKPPKQKRCKVCLEKFTPWRTTQKVCSPSCAVILTKRDEEKRRKREKREALVKLRTVSDWTKLAQVEFNRFIRMRDQFDACISCGTLSWDEKVTGGGWDCSHYRSIGANPELRFEELNAHRACKKCNKYLSGNIVNYRIRLEGKIGLDKLAWLEGYHPPKRYRIEELIAIRDKYRAKCNELKKARAA